MKKVSTAAVKVTKNFSQQKLTIGLDLGDRSIWYCVLEEAGEIVMWYRRTTQVRAVTALLFALVAVQAVGQAATGTLRGRVSDTHGNTVGGAQVLLYIGTHTEARATAVSNPLGQLSTQLAQRVRFGFLWRMQDENCTKVVLRLF